VFIEIKQKLFRLYMAQTLTDTAQGTMAHWFPLDESRKNALSAVHAMFLQ
jgi:hypothetical protein